VSPVPRRRRLEVEADLHELFTARRNDRGAVDAHLRLYHDVASLWLESRRVAVAEPRRSRFALLQDARHDLTYGARLFARQPAILALTVLGLSLGLAIATAVFSIMNAALLRGEGLVDSNRAPGILRITDRSTSTTWRYDEFLHLRAGATRIQVEGLLRDAALVRTAAADTEGRSASLAFVTGGFFAATGGQVTAGRPLVPADEKHTGPPPVVVSSVFWSSKLNRDPDVVGRVIQIGRTDATIVGVAEDGFSVPGSREIWMPLTAYGPVYYNVPVPRAPESGVQVFGRLLPDASLADAEAQLSGVAATLPATSPTGNDLVGIVNRGETSSLRVTLDPHQGLGRLSSSETLLISVVILGAIGLVLLLACANVATVLIATAITREREMGVRAALGASRARIVRQLMTESLALGVLAAAIGLLVARWAIPAIGTMIEAPAGVDLAPDLNVYLFLAIVTVVTGATAGLAPARHGGGADLVTPLKGEGAQQQRMAPRRLRATLVMIQAAVSVLLIVVAALFVRASSRAVAIDVGFDAAGLYEVYHGLGREAFEGDAAGVRSFFERARVELEAVPGIASTTLAEITPFEGAIRTAIRGEGTARVTTYFNRTHSEYFETLGLRILVGRTYTRDEVAGKVPVALVSQSLARVHWPDQSPLGQLLPEQIPIGGGTRPTVIGVVEDAITARLQDPSPFAVYEPLDPASEPFAKMLVRVGPGAVGAIDEVRQRLRAIDPQADVRIASIEARVDQEAGRPRMLATLTGIVGANAIVLCVIGLYGLTASVVGQRTREIGVRTALGATSLDVLRLLMWDNLRPVVLGLVVGAGAAMLASRILLSTILFGVSPHDPLAYAGGAIVLLAATMLAVFMPTRRAAAVDAAAVLKGS
jgi:predicted permease